jgi:hypothetical protein
MTQNWMMTLTAITKENGPKSTPNRMISSTSTAVKRVTKPLTVGLSKRLRNYNKNANAVNMITQVQTLLKHIWKNQEYTLI